MHEKRERARPLPLFIYSLTSIFWRRITLPATLTDVAKELQKPGRDPRDELPPPILRTDIMEIKDLQPGMVLTGTVRNVIDFGVFVDIGVHQDGLVHISQIRRTPPPGSGR